jgi:LysM repeat protein
MSEIRILPVLALVIALILPATVSAQVPVDVSNEKMIYGGKVYRMHEVLKNQTLYSISKAYRVTIPEIERENVIPASGIQEGQTLKIPSREDISETQSSPRTVTQPAPRPAQSVASGTGPSYDPATGIRISSEKIVYSGRNYYMHEVLKGQTLYSIAKAYRVTILDIDRENAIPAGGIQAGQVLRIPVASSMMAQEEVAAPAAGKPSSPVANQPSGTTQPATTAKQPETTSQPATVTPQAATTSQPATAVTQPAATSQSSDTGKQTQAATQGSAATPKPETQKAQAEKKKIHKVQKGESLADIANKYNISVQELKQANKGVIFAMPDMRLVIPVKEDQEPTN